MLSEKDMEAAIASKPEKYLREKGLKLIDRQFYIGNYIFDLLFQDRHGAKVIVEIQKGTLDRNHSYKILDYYDEYKERNPKEFIELIIIANKITRERKKRLSSVGVTCIEIPLEVFVDDKEQREKNANAAKFTEDQVNFEGVYPGFPTSLTTENIRFLYY